MVLMLLVLVLLVVLLGVDVGNVLLESLVLLDVLGILGQLGVLVFLLGLVGGGTHGCNCGGTVMEASLAKLSSLYITGTPICRHHNVKGVWFAVDRTCGSKKHCICLSE